MCRHSSIRSRNSLTLSLYLSLTPSFSLLKICMQEVTHFGWALRFPLPILLQLAVSCSLGLSISVSLNLCVWLSLVYLSFPIFICVACLHHICIEHFLHSRMMLFSKGLLVHGYGRLSAGSKRQGRVSQLLKSLAPPCSLSSLRGGIGCEGM